MRGLQNIKLNKGWLCNTFDTCERRGQIPQPQSTELNNYIYCFRFHLIIIVIIIIIIIIIISNPGIRGYRKRLISKWKENGGFETSEQRLADQARAIKINGWLSEIEIEELKREAMADTEGEEEAHGLSDVIGEQQTNTDGGEQDTLNNTTENATSGVQTEQQRADIIEGLSEEEKGIYSRIMEAVNSQERKGLPPLRNVNRKKLKEEVKKVNGVLGKVDAEEITTTNTLIYAGAVVVTERLGVKAGKRSQKREPMWKRRLESQIKGMRADLSRVEVLLRGKTVKEQHRRRLEQKYKLSENGLKYVSEDLKQRIIAKSKKLQRYINRNKQFVQNRMFETDQRRFYEELDGNRNSSQVTPDPEEARQYWNGIWGEETTYEKDAEWLQKVREEVEPLQQDNISITVETVIQFLKKVPNWKAPGPDLVQGFWIKNFTSLHTRIANNLQSCLDTGNVPDWMTKGRTTLIMKDPEKGAAAGNYRPITCLPVMWKLLTGIISDKLYESLDERNILPDEQKGCRKGTQGTNDQLLIDKMILKESKARRKNLALGWIDYKKAYDMIPHPWILECLGLVGTAQNVKNLLANSMNGWKTELTSNGESLGNVDIKRGIFQGDSLSPLLFVIAMIPLTLILRKCEAGYYYRNNIKINHLLFMDDLKLYAKSSNQLDSLIQTVRIFSNDIGMKFGIEKCAVLILKRGKVTQSEGITLPDDTKIRSLKEGEGYKYLGVLEADTMLHRQMKEKIKKEYLRRVRKVAQSKLNGGNLIRAINTWAVSLIRYAGGIIEWTKQELKELDRRTRKLLTMNGGLHPRDCVARLYVPRKHGGRGLISVEDCINQARLSLERYVQSSEEELLKAVREDDTGSQETATSFKARRRTENTKEWKEKPLYGQFARETEDQSNEETWTWLKQGSLKRETEALIIAAQDQAIRTNYIKAKIDKSQTDAKCRMCRDKNETVSHILSGCSKLAQKEYKKRHDNVARAIHWDLSGKCGFDRNDKWYNHVPESVLENENYKLLWDFSIRTDHNIEARRPDLVLVDKSEKRCQIIDVAIPEDSGVKEKEDEKIEKYQNLARELRRIWEVKTKVVPIVVGALGTVPLRLKANLKGIGVDTSITLIQKSALLGSARILRKVLEM